MDGTAIVYCEGHFDLPSGKTAHGLVRGTARYKVLGVLNSARAGQDAGEVLDGRPAGILFFNTLKDAIKQIGDKPDYMVIGIAPDGGKLPNEARATVLEALRLGINVDSGLHQYLSDDSEFATAAAESGAAIRDVRRCKPVSELHFFEGKIDQVGSLRIAVLGTDSAVGKRTTAKILLEAFRARGITAEMVGTGQTAWFQGMPYTMLLDATINDFVSGEIEDAVWRAWTGAKPRVILLEGQGCMTNPAYPGGFELLAAGRPHAVILQHAPKRRVYDGFPEFPLAGLDTEKKLIEILSRGPVAAITINHEDMTREEIDATAREYEEKYGIPAVDPLVHGPEKIIAALEKRFPEAFAP